MSCNYNYHWWFFSKDHVTSLSVQSDLLTQVLIAIMQFVCSCLNPGNTAHASETETRVAEEQRGPCGFIVFKCAPTYFVTFQLGHFACCLHSFNISDCRRVGPVFLLRLMFGIYAHLLTFIHFPLRIIAACTSSKTCFWSTGWTRYVHSLTMNNEGPLSFLSHKLHMIFNFWFCFAVAQFWGRGGECSHTHHPCSDW